MDIKIGTPVQIFINGKFFCVANEVHVTKNSPEFKKSLIPDNIKMDSSQFTGTVVNIKRPPRTKKEKAELKKSNKQGSYDEFFQRMVEATDDPNARTPVDWDNEV